MTHSALKGLSPDPPQYRKCPKDRWLFGHEHLHPRVEKAAALQISRHRRLFEAHAWKKLQAFGQREEGMTAAGIFRFGQMLRWRNPIFPLKSLQLKGINTILLVVEFLLGLRRRKKFRQHHLNQDPGQILVQPCSSFLNRRLRPGFCLFDFLGSSPLILDQVNEHR